jgi:DNA-binding XRE family transcriptional regulator
MNKEELRQALDALGWKQSELSRKLGVTTSTVSRWATGEPIPVWLAEYMRVMLELDRLHNMYVRPPKPVKGSALPVETPAPRTKTRAAAMARTLQAENLGFDNNIEPKTGA